MIDFSMMTSEQYAEKLRRDLYSNIKNALTLAYCGYKADRAKADKAKVNSTNSGTKANTSKSRKPTSAPAAAQTSDSERLRELEKKYHRMMEENTGRQYRTIDVLDAETEYCIALGNEMKQINAERAARQREQARKGKR